MMNGFAIIPDGRNHPTAMFSCLEDAMDWALQTYGGDAFRIRFIRVAAVDRQEVDGNRHS